jgi:hypothetical protein
MIPPTLPRPPLKALAALAALAFAASAAAQQGESSGIPPSTFEGQAPITEKDIPAAKALLTSARVDRAGSALGVIGAEYGYDEARILYVTTKILAGISLLTPEMGMNEDSVAEIHGTRLAVPTPGELDVIRAHLPELVRAVTGQ